MRSDVLSTIGWFLVLVLQNIAIILMFIKIELYNLYFQLGLLWIKLRQRPKQIRLGCKLLINYL
jgi:hypothetical protein